MMNEGLRDDQWERIRHKLPGTKGHVGRRASTSTRLFVEAVLWLVRSGGRWRDLPERFGKVQTVKTRYYRWVENGVFDRLFSDLSRDADTEWHIPDSTVVRAHGCAAGARRKKGGRMPRALAGPEAVSPAKSTPPSTAWEIQPRSPSPAGNATT